MHYEAFTKHIDVSRETFARLEIYVTHLLKWQQRINLISPTTIHEVWHRHILDSAQFAFRLDRKSDRIMDLGSGAGLPGLILSILGFQQVHLVESDQRKAVFLQEAVRLTSCNAIIHDTRIESITLKNIDIITARACAPLGQLLAWCYPLIGENTICLFAKGKNCAKEIDDARVGWSFDCTQHISITDPESVLLQLQHLTPRIS